MKTIALIPNFDKPYSSISEIAINLFDLVTDDFNYAESIISSRPDIKIVIIMGVGKYNPREAFYMLKSINKTLDISVIDGRDWGIPGQYYLPGDNTVTVIKKALML